MQERHVSIGGVSFNRKDLHLCKTVIHSVKLTAIRFLVRRNL